MRPQTRRPPAAPAEAPGGAHAQAKRYGRVFCQAARLLGRARVRDVHALRAPRRVDERCVLVVPRPPGLLGARAGAAGVPVWRARELVSAPGLLPGWRIESAAAAADLWMPCSTMDSQLHAYACDDCRHGCVERSSALVCKNACRHSWNPELKPRALRAGTRRDRSPSSSKLASLKPPPSQPPKSLPLSARASSPSAGDAAPPSPVRQRSGRRNRRVRFCTCAGRNPWVYGQQCTCQALPA